MYEAKCAFHYGMVFEGDKTFGMGSPRDKSANYEVPLTTT